MKIYTKAGDDGSTALGDGTRVTKGHSRIDAYGDIDEANSCLGAARAALQGNEMERFLKGIQSDLFAIGAQVADPKYDAAKRKEKTRITDERVAELEKQIDAIEKNLPMLRSFILPAGAPAACWLHVSRAVVRRAERKVVGLQAISPVPPIVVKYLNRLSDLLFVMARRANQAAGEQQVEW